MEKAPKPYKNRVFLRWSSKNVKKQKEWIFSKNCLTLFVSGREKKRAFSCTLSVLAKIFFGPKQCKPGKTMKIVVSAEIAQNQKWHLFFEKGVFFDMGEKVGFTNCVFEKLCFTENTIFIVFSAKHIFSKAKWYVEKTANLWKIVGCFWTWQNVWGGCFFWGFSVIVVWFWCVWHSSRSVKMLAFPSFWGFCGVAYSCLFWVWKV